MKGTPPPVDDKITIGSTFKALGTFVRWCAIVFLCSIPLVWIFVPTYRYGVRHVDGPGPQPTDCDFMTAPLGNKGCHYDMRRVLIDKDGNYIATVN